VITVGDLSYDPERRRLAKYGRPLSLSPAPLKLLAFLMEHSERSFTVDELIAHLWGEGAPCDERARAVIWSQIRRIRLTIEDDTGPWLISEGAGRGYSLWLETPVSQASLLAMRA
jgi:DNA-binding response OmpR family regulator